MPADNRVRLIHEIDASQSLATAEQVERRWAQSHAGIDRAVRGTAQHMQRFGTVASSAIGAVTAGVAAQERSWISLGTAVLAAFAAGGPVAGGVALLAAGVGIVTHRTRELDEAQTSVFARSRTLLDEATAAARHFTDEVKEKSGFDALAAGAERSRAEAADLGKQLNALLDAKTKLDRLGGPFESRINVEGLGTLTGGQVETAIDKTRAALNQAADAAFRFEDAIRFRTQSGEIAAQRLGESIREEAEQMVRLAEAGSSFTRFVEEVDAAAAKLLAQGASKEDVDAYVSALRQVEELERRRESANILRDVERQNELLRERDPVKRAELAIDREVEEIYRRLVELGQIRTEEEAKRVRIILGERKELQKREVGYDFDAEVKRFREGVGPQISSALSDAIIDGFESGFDNAEDIARSFFRSLLSQLLNLLITAGLRSAFPVLFPSAQGNVLAGGQIVPFARGGVVDRPTLFPMRGATGLMGEAGPEAIVPLRRTRDGRLGVEASGGSGGTVINFNGVSVGADFLSLPEAAQERIIGRAWSSYMRRNPSGKRAVATARRASLQ